MTSSVDLYEHLFYAAQKDVQGMEKDAVVREGAQRGVQWGTDMLNRAGVNNLPLAEIFNNSSVGQIIASGLNRLTGRPNAPTRTRQSSLDHANKLNREASQLENAARVRGSSTADSADARVDRAFDEMFASMSPEEAARVRGVNPSTMPANQQLAVRSGGRMGGDGGGSGGGGGGGGGSGGGPAPGSGADAASRGLNPWAVGVGTVGTVGVGTAAGLGGYHYGQRQAEEEWKRRRNMAFGAGVSTGTAAPYVYRQVDRGIRSLWPSQE